MKVLLLVLALLAATASAVLPGSSAVMAAVDVWALPEGFKLDRSGVRLFSLDRSLNLAALRRRSSIWDSATRTVSLRGARGETLAFQLMIGGGTTGCDAVQVDYQALPGPEGASLDRSHLKLFKAYYTEVDRGSGPTNGPLWAAAGIQTPWCPGRWETSHLRGLRRSALSGPAWRHRASGSILPFCMVSRLALLWLPGRLSTSGAASMAVAEGAGFRHPAEDPQHLLHELRRWTT